MKDEIIRLANEYAYDLDESTKKIDEITAKETFKRRLNALFDKRIVNSTFTEYEKQVSTNSIELIAQNKDKYILDEGVLYFVELVEKYTIVPINQP